MEENQQKGVKRAVIILLALFLLSAILFIYDHFKKDERVEEDVVVTTEVESDVNQGDVPSNNVEEDTTKEDSAESNLSEDEKKSSDIAKKFISAIYAFNGDEPNKGIEEAKEYSTDTLYSMMKDAPQTARPTSEVYSREVSDIAVEEPEYPSDGFTSWIVKVTGELKNKDGEKTGDDTEIYLVRLEQIKDQYKVSEYVINPNL